MGTHLDIIGSVIIAGMIILNFAFFMGERQNSQIRSTNKATQQNEVTDVTSIMRHDILKAGYGVDTMKILKATPTCFSFRADLANSGNIDTITYLFGDGASSIVKDSKLGMLYRIVNGRKVHGDDLGITEFEFRYYRLGSKSVLVETTDIPDIRLVGVRMRVKSSMSAEGEYQYGQTDFTISPKNLN